MQHNPVKQCLNGMDFTLNSNNLLTPTSLKTLIFAFIQSHPNIYPKNVE
jgi:hypothetical protein